MKRISISRMAEKAAEVGRYNDRRLLGLIGNMPPVEAEARYHAQLEAPALAA